MVQVIENQAQIQGIIQAINKHPSLADYSIVTLLYTGSQAVAGKVNLLSQPPGTTLELSVRTSLLKDGVVGASLRCLAKRTPNGVMCEKEPDPGNFVISPPP